MYTVHVGPVSLYSTPDPARHSTYGTVPYGAGFAVKAAKRDADRTLPYRAVPCRAGYSVKKTCQYAESTATYVTCEVDQCIILYRCVCVCVCVTDRPNLPITRRLSICIVC